MMEGLEVVVPKKQWENMSEAQQDYVKGKNQMLAEVLKLLKGDV